MRSRGVARLFRELGVRLVGSLRASLETNGCLDPELVLMLSRVTGANTDNAVTPLETADHDRSLAPHPLV